MGVVIMIQMETLIPDAIKAGECLAEIKKRAKHDTGTHICYYFVLQSGEFFNV